MKKFFVHLLLMTGFISCVTGQTIIRGEYFFDADPGIGNGTSVAFTVPGDTVTQQLNIPTAGLSPGSHVFCLRTQNASNNWSHTFSKTFFVKSAVIPVIQFQVYTAEYFFDTDPGTGNGTPVVIASQGDTIARQLSISSAGLSAGPHSFCLRTKNILGNWSHTSSRTFFVTDPPQQEQVVAAEYFYDTDPGLGNGIPFVVPQSDSVNSSFLSTNPFSSGLHYLVVRTKDAGGQWSLQMSKAFNVCSTYGANSDFTYFIDRKTLYFNNISTYDTAFIWNFGDAASTTVQRNPAHRYATAGIKTVSLITSNICATDTEVQTIALTGLQSINAEFSADTNDYVGHVKGIGFLPGCTILLKQGGTSITADSTIFISSTDLKVLFNFRHPPQGWYDVIILNQPAYNDTLYHAFQVQPLRKPTIEFKSSENTRARPGTKGTAHFWIRNTSNITLYMLPFYIFYDTVGSSVVTLRGDLGIIPPIDPLLAALKPADNSYWVDDPYNPDGPQIKMIAGMVPYMAPNQTFDIYLDVYSPVESCKTFKAMVGNPFDDYFKNRLTGSCDFLPNTVKCAFDILSYNGIAGCVYGMLNIGCSIGNQINTSLIDSTYNTNHGHDAWDIPINMASTLVSCASAAYAPIGGLGKTIDIVSKIATSTALFGDCSNSVVDFANWDPLDVAKQANVCHHNGGYDPNAKFGPVGITADNYVNKYRTVDYAVEFENVDTASGPAAIVIIKDKVDSSKFDLSTFSFNSFSFGDTLFYVPDEFRTEIVQDIDLRNTRNIWLRVNGKFDTATGDIEWRFTSYDTTTFDLISDPQMGFLPPNLSPPEGQGYISYSVKPKSSSAHGDVLHSDSASIIFDTNNPVLTNDWINTIDTIKPTSVIQPLAATQNDTAFRIYLTGSDAHAGIMDYIIYASINDSAYKVVALGLPCDSMQFNGMIGNNYKFISQARDRAMNVEDTVHLPDAVTVVVVGTDDLPFNTSVDIYPNPSSVSVSVLIRSDKRMQWKVTLFTMEGKQSRISELNSNENKMISLTSLRSGMYYLKIENESRQFLIRKIIVIN